MGAANGAFDVNARQNNNCYGAWKDNTISNTDGISFDASRSSPIYGNSTTVQPASIVLIPQIKY